MADQDRGMPESTFLEELGVLLRKEHERLQVHFDGRFAQQEKLLHQLARGHAHHPRLELPGSHEIPLSFPAQNDLRHVSSTNGSPAHGSRQIGLHNLQSDSSTCTFDKACKQEVQLPCAAHHESKDVASQQGSQHKGSPGDSSIDSSGLHFEASGNEPSLPCAAQKDGMRVASKQGTKDCLGTVRSACESHGLGVASKQGTRECLGTLREACESHGLGLGDGLASKQGTRLLGTLHSPRETLFGNSAASKQGTRVLGTVHSVTGRETLLTVMSSGLKALKSHSNQSLLPGSYGTKSCTSSSSHLRSRSDASLASDASLFKRKSLLQHDFKVGTTSPLRILKDLDDQFRRLAGRGADELPVSRLLQIVNGCGDNLDIEEVTEAVRAMVPVSSAPSACPPAKPSFYGLFEGSPSSAKEKEIALTRESFVHFMLEDDPPPGVEMDVLIIREAIDNERLSHHDELNEICVSRIKQKGSYGNSPLIVDIVGASVILMNGLVIGLSSDVAPEHPVWTTFEYVFLLHFIAEVIFHVCREGYYKYFMGREWRWNIFDFTLVAFAAVEAIISKIAMSKGGTLSLLTNTLRMARLLRLIRLLRFKVFAELKQMIYGVVAGVRVLAWAILLLIVFIYIISLVLRQTIGADQESTYSSMFENVPWTMFTVFNCFTDGCLAPDGTPLHVYLYTRHGLIFLLLYVVGFIFVTIGIFNLIMATFIDNVMRVSLERKQIERAGNDYRMRAELTHLIVKFWMCDRDTLKRMKTFGASPEISERKEREVMRDLQQVVVTREMLQLWLCHPDFIDILARLEIAHSEHSRLFDALNCDLSGELEGHELVKGLMALRGPIEKLDVISTLLAVRHVVAMVKNVEESVKPYESD